MSSPGYKIQELTSQQQTCIPKNLDSRPNVVNAAHNFFADEID